MKEEDSTPRDPKTIEVTERGKDWMEKIFIDPNDFEDNDSNSSESWY